MEEQINFIFEDKSEVDSTIYSEDPYYDLFAGGYIKPENMLVDPEQIAEVYSAINIIEQFLSQAEERGHIEIL